MKPEYERTNCVTNSNFRLTSIHKGFSHSHTN